MDSTHLIERLDVFEERTSVRLESLFADWIKDGYAPPFTVLNLNRELHPREGNEIQQHITLIVDVYDSEGRIVGRGEQLFYPESFFGFESFSISINLTVDDLAISKIRVYPKPM